MNRINSYQIRMARGDAESGAQGAFLVERSVVSPRRYQAGTGWLPVFRGLLQPHHRSLRGAAEASGARSGEGPHLADRVSRHSRRAAGRKPQPVPINLAKADVKSLVAVLRDPNLTVRLQAANQLVERGGNEAVAAFQPIVKTVG